MTRRQINTVREKVLAHILLRRLRSFQGDVLLPELYEAFRAEPIHGDVQFWGYAAFAKWIGKNPSLVVEIMTRGTNRPHSILRVDARAALFVGARTGETLHVDFQQLRDDEFTPYGDFSPSMQHEEWS